MELRLHDSVDEFCDVAVDIYRRDPIAATVELTVLRGLSADNDPQSLLVTVWEAGAPIGAAVQIPPFPLLCGGLPEAVAEDITADFVAAGVHLTGIRGPCAVTTGFASAWSAATGDLSSVTMRERLYRLAVLRPPAAVAGEPRPSIDDDTAMLVEWLISFHGEALGDVSEAAATPQSVRAARQLGDEFLLWTRDHQPVSMALARLPAEGVSRIGPVYTAVDQRGHGYGSAVTAAATAWSRERGAEEVVLFTDLANPISNAIYQRIGFRPVSDFVDIEFTASA